ncbi:MULTISPECIES: hypothetical protein [Mycolicibacterium]|uniref:Uncharacterized protein n=1 Tax=Mycolicibacterium mucogenicum DSM 44124 TaxID=1226753 RepID=A0A8E4W614_MYCMU|nr:MULTISPECIES: hypothetical protein [Mycolicibacterium]QPG72697.1 hypothetical protein C1S78_026565 [Mycolicibacterium mucogenicum DSM 44124]
MTAVIGVGFGGRPSTGESLLDRIEEALQCLSFPIFVPDFAFNAAYLIELPPQLIPRQGGLEGGSSISEQSALTGKLLAVVVGLLNIGGSGRGDVVISDPQRAHLPHRNPSASVARAGSGPGPAPRAGQGRRRRVLVPRGAHQRRGPGHHIAPQTQCDSAVRC